MLKNTCYLIRKNGGAVRAACCCDGNLCFAVRAFFFGRLCRRCRFLVQLVQLADDKEHDKGHDQEIDQLGDEQAVSDNGGLLFGGLQGCVMLAV